MANWVYVAKVEDMVSGSPREVVADDRVIAIFRVGGDYYALDGLCAHQGGPLGKGCLEGHIVTCPWHGWQYDIRSGQHQSIAPLAQRMFPTKVERGELFVDVGQ